MDEELMNQFFYGGGDEEQKIAEATQVLQKIAEEEGVDLNSLSEDQQNALLGQLVGEEGGEDTGDGDAGGEEVDKAASLTPYDVHQELSKVAQVEGIDLNQVDREEYNAAFDKLAEDMRDPSYFEKRAEEQQKIAEADAVGRVMAHSFHDELNKIAAGGKAEAVRAALGRVARKAGRGAGDAEKAVSGAVGRKAVKGTRFPGGGSRNIADPVRTGRAAMGLGAGAGAAGAGAGYAAGRSKESALEDPAVQSAIQVLEDRGLLQD